MASNCFATTATAPGPSSLSVLLLTFGLLLVVLSSTSVQHVHGQFFTKTSKSVPRLGRRGDPAAAPPASLNAFRSGDLNPSGLKDGATIEGTPLDRFFRKYDSDGDWCLSPEELWRDGGAAGGLFAAAALVRRHNMDALSNDVPMRGRRIGADDVNRGQTFMDRILPLKRK